VEPRDIAAGDIDILVCDGMIGNTVLKMYEGVALNLFEMLKAGIMKSFRTKLGGIMLKPVFSEIKGKMDYSEYGGTAFLGSRGICIKAHGSSNGKAFKNAIKRAVDCYDNKVIDKIKSEIEKIPEIESDNIKKQ
jgi:glycerol-3-phosphate acyltransferase PlsX